jgi:hypothetical protein
MRYLLREGIESLREEIKRTIPLPLSFLSLIGLRREIISPEKL